MIQATRAKAKPRNSVPVATPEFEALGEAYKKLESSITDARCAAIVLETVIEDALTTPDVVGMYKRFYLTEDQVDSVFFALYNAGNFARALYAEYYAGFGETPDGNVTLQSAAEIQVAS